ncbi:MAG TPA: hypothetical protein IAB53_06075 [Candidatus Scybalocola faecipullorum]|nr:hypothetical protein [Candidatus Scybalocola faecipullorum]
MMEKNSLWKITLAAGTMLLLVLTVTLLCMKCMESSGKSSSFDGAALVKKAETMVETGMKKACGR